MEEKGFFENHNKDEQNKEMGFKKYKQNKGLRQNDGDKEGNENQKDELEYENYGQEGNFVEEKIEKVIMQKKNIPQKINARKNIAKSTKLIQIKTNNKTSITNKNAYNNLKEHKPYNAEERATRIIYSNKNLRINPSIDEKFISEERKNNHKFHTSFYTKKNKTSNYNSYSNSSYKVKRKSSYPINTNININPQRRPLQFKSNNNSSYFSNISNSYISNYNSYIPSTQNTSNIRTNLLNEYVKCPNCSYIFNPNEEKYGKKTEYIRAVPKQTINYKLHSRPTISSLSSLSCVPFDTYNKRSVATTIEKKTKCPLPNIYTNEFGTTIFTQPKREVQVIRKSFGDNGEVFEEEIGGEDYDKRKLKNSGGSRFSYGNRAKGGDFYESRHGSSSYKEIRRYPYIYH